MRILVGYFERRNLGHRVFLIGTPANIDWIRRTWESYALAKYRMLRVPAMKDRDIGNRLQDNWSGVSFHEANVPALPNHETFGRFIEWGGEADNGNDAWLLKVIGAVDTAPPEEYEDERRHRLGVDAGGYIQGRPVVDLQAEGGARLFYLLDISRGSHSCRTTAAGAHFINCGWQGLPDHIKQSIKGA